jgi:hypothetical protein
MAFNINEIKSQLAGGGARQNLFQVRITNPANGSADIKVPFLVQASQIPAAGLGTIQVPYFGRTIKLAGDRQYAPWEVLVINDEDFKIRNAMEEWSNKINRFQGNIRELANYKSQAQVIQYGKDGRILREYEFVGLWPANISEIGLDWGANDQIETFGVTFEFDFWRVSGGITGNAGGQ